MALSKTINLQNGLTVDNAYIRIDILIRLQKVKTF